MELSFEPPTKLLRIFNLAPHLSEVQQFDTLALTHGTCSSMEMNPIQVDVAFLVHEELCRVKI